MTQEAMKLALEALENSVDLVREDAYQAEKLYGNYPTRQGKVNGLKVLADDHEKAITALRESLAHCDLCGKRLGGEGDIHTCTPKPEQERPQNCGSGYCSCIECVMQPEQEPVAWVRDHELPLAPGEAFSWVETFVHKTPLYTTPQAQPAQRQPLTLQELQTAWDAQADKFNQWDELGLDEIVAWAQAVHNIKENT